MLEVLGVSNSFLTYHLENLGELVCKMEDGKYRLSSFGEDAIATMTRVEDIPAAAPHQSRQVKPKKIVWKSVTFALGLICIVLIAFIAYFAVAGISAQNSNSNLQNKNNELQTWLRENETSLNQTQTWLYENETLLNQTQTWLNGNSTAHNQLRNEVSSVYISGNENTTVLEDNQTIYVTALLENWTFPFVNGTSGWLIALPSLNLGTFPSAGFVAVLFSSNCTSSVFGFSSNSTLSVIAFWPNSTSSGGSISPSNALIPSSPPIQNAGNGIDFSVGSSGVMFFPVLPSTSYGMMISNFPETVPTSYYFTLTIIYYY